MNKYFFNLIGCLCLMQCVFAQSLEDKIPTDANAVAVINSDRFFDLMSVNEFDQSKIGALFFRKISEKGRADIKSIEDFGIDVHSKIYIYSTRTDSIVYYGMLVPLADARKLKVRLQDLGTAEEMANGTQRLVLAEKKQILMWDDKVLYLLSANLQDGYFEEPEIATKYGLSNKRLADYYDVDPLPGIEEVPAPPITDTVVSEDSFEQEVDSLVVEEESMIDTLAYDDIYLDSAYTPAAADTVDYDDYYTRLAADDSIKMQLTTQWISLEMDRLRGNNVSFNNKSLNRWINKKALASIWIRNVDELYSGFLPVTLYNKILGTPKHFTTGFGRANIDLIVEGNQLKLDGSLDVAPDQARLYRKMYKRKLNSKFFKYLDGNAMGYMAYAVNTEAYLKELPKLIQHYYGGLLNRYEGELDLGTTLFSLLLDEKAVGKMIKGDAIFALNGVDEQEVKYTSYEYDDDYNSIEVEKTKKESFPSFLAMFSSDDMTLFEKIIKLGIAKGEVHESDGLYTLQTKKSPFELHLLLKDGIVFLGTSKDDLENIQHKRYRAGMKSKQRNILRNNNMALLFHSKKLVKAVGALDLPASKEMLNLQEKIDAFGDFYFTSRGMRKNTMVATLHAELPPSHKNGLQYMLYLIENVAFGDGPK